MPLKYKNLDGIYKIEIEYAVKQAISFIDIISDEKLRRCVKDRLENSGTIKIRRDILTDKKDPKSDDCYTDPDHVGQNRQLGIGRFVYRPKEITICIVNIANKDELPMLWHIIIHEFAHSCGWEHGQGKGVPLDSGTHHMQVLSIDSKRKKKSL